MLPTRFEITRTCGHGPHVLALNLIRQNDGVLFISEWLLCHFEVPENK